MAKAIMDKKTVLKILSRFRKALESQGIMIEKLVLYGSFATESYHEGSDIDVVVVSEDFTGKGYWERIDILTEAIYTVFEPIEAIAVTPEEWDKKESPIVEFAQNGEIINI